MNARALGIIILLAGVLVAGVAAVVVPETFRPAAVGLVIGVAGVAGGRRILSDRRFGWFHLALMAGYGLCVGAVAGAVAQASP